MNKTLRSALTLLLCTCILGGVAAPAQVHAQQNSLPQDAIRWQIVESDDQHLRLDITIHDDDPALNGRGILLGVPTLDDLALQVTAQQSVLLPPLPGPTPPPPLPIDNLLDAPPPLVLATPPRVDDTAPVAIAQSGMLRDQPFVLLRVYPRRFDAGQNQDRVYTSLQVELRWQSPVPSDRSPQRAAGGPFEAVLAQTLHNYADLNRPQKAVVPEEEIVDPLAYWPNPKFTVSTAGLYQVTYADLVAVGAELEYIHPSGLHLLLNGEEQPLWLNDGNDGRFDPGDWLRFYGYGQADLYTAANVYVLTYDDAPGLRMPERILQPDPSAPAAFDFATTIHAEENNYYWQTMPNGAGQDHWFWGGPINAGASYAVTLTTPYVAISPNDVTLQVYLRGRTTAAQTPNHHTRIYLNDALIDEQSWAGQVPFTHTVTLSHTTISAHHNQVRVENVGDTGADADIVFLDRVRLDYQRMYYADNNWLEMSAPQPGPFQVDISAFDDAAPILLDITFPDSPMHLLGTEVEEIEVGDDLPAYTLHFADNAQPGARYLALSNTALRHPDQISADVGSHWRSPLKGADSILITHADFVTATQRLANFQRSRGLRTVVVDVADLYDEFSYSRFTPAAIRDFIAYAYAEWQAPAPTYVTLIGDATIDYRDYQGSGTRNFVPTALTQTQFMGDTPTDNWFVAVSGDDPLPDLLIGRLSVDSAAQADAVVDKIIAYAESPATAPVDSMLMVSDDDSSDFAVASAELAAVLPASLSVDTVDAAQFPPGNPQQIIVDAFSAGRTFVHYTGHGTVYAWGTWGPENKERLLTNTDVASLPAGAPLTVMTVSNCLNGFFSANANQVSMAEAFQRQPARGAVAVWAPTGLSYPAGHLELMKAFYQTLLGDGSPDQSVTLGAAATAAKITVYTQGVFWTDLVESYTLFGDPSTRLPNTGSPFLRYLPLVQAE